MIAQADISVLTVDFIYVFSEAMHVGSVGMVCVRVFDKYEHASQ